MQSARGHLTDTDHVTFEMFQKDYNYWQECGGLRSFTVEQMDRIFCGLFRTWVRAAGNPSVSDKDKKSMDSFMNAARTEHQRRQEYRCMIEVGMEKLE